LRVEKEPAFAAKAEVLKPVEPVVADRLADVQPEPESAQEPAQGMKQAEGITYPGDMANAPKDGRPVWLQDADGVQVEGHWRRTRAMVKAQWTVTEFWAVWPGTMPLGFEPVGWFEARGI
jgi:hypothetical protein